MSQRIDVGVLGATGMVGQQFIAQLASHPWFRLTWLGASERSAGQLYKDAAPWRLPASIPPEIASMVVQEARPGNGAPELVFSAMDASVAGEIEEAFAKAAFALKSFEMSDVIETQFGFHLMLLLDRRPGKDVKFEDVKANIKEVYAEKLRTMVVQHMRKTAKVVVSASK